MTAAVLEKSEGKVVLRICIDELPDGAIEVDRLRITTQTSSKITKYPPASFAPMTASEKIQQLVHEATLEGYDLTSDPMFLDEDSYSFLLSIDEDDMDRLVDVNTRFGHHIAVDPASQVTTIVGTEFEVNTVSNEIRMSGLLNVSRNPDGDATLLHHLALARCISPLAKAYMGNGVEVDVKDKLSKAARAGKLAERDLEVLYTFSVLRRPIDITSGDKENTMFELDF